MSHHLRLARIRFSLLALMTFLTVACLVLGWWYQRKPFIAEAFLRVQYSANDGDTEHQVEFFRETVITLAKSEFVLDAALSRKNISQLPYVSMHEDPLKWIKKELDVSFAGKSGMLVVSLRGVESAMPDYCKLIDGVVESYMNDIVHSQRIRKAEEEESKSKALKQIRRELEEKIERLHTLTETLGPEEAADSAIVLLQAEVEVLTNVWKELQTELLREEFRQKTSVSEIVLLKSAMARRD